MCGSKRRKASKKSRSVPGSRSAVVSAQVVWETKTRQTPSVFCASRKCVSTVSVMSTISSFFLVVTVMVFMGGSCFLMDFALHLHYMIIRQMEGVCECFPERGLKWLKKVP